MRHPSRLLLGWLAASVIVHAASTGRGPSADGSTPFHGTPAALPGTLQAEDFDDGAEGIAYHDNSSGNAGGVYRITTDVDIAAATDAGGGYTLGWVGSGEWLNYTVNVTAGGLYDIDVRVASAGAGGTFHIEASGADLTGALTVPDTGGWQTWKTIRKSSVALNAGVQVWRIVMDTRGASGAVGNFNDLRVTATASGSASTPFTGMPVALPGVVQAEEFDAGGQGIAYADTTAGNSGGVFRTTDVDLAAAQDTGGGYLVGWIRPGEWLNYSVDVAAAGAYRLEFRVASSGVGGTFHVEANGVDKTGPITIPNTGGHQAWTTIAKDGVALAAGQQTMALVMDGLNGGGFGNINYVRVLAGGGGGSGSTAFNGTPASLPGVIEAERFDEGGAGVAYIDTTPGNSGAVFRSTDVDIAVASDTGGGYTLGWVRAGEWLNYTVDVTAAGTYAIEARVAAGNQGGRFHIEVNGADVTGPLTIPYTGGWQTWTTLRKTGVALDAGLQRWRVVMDANGATSVGNVNYFRVVPAQAGAILRGPYLQHVTDTEASIVWTTSDPGRAEVRYARAGASVSTVPADTRQFTAAETGLGSDFYQHEVRLLALTPATQYVYDVLMGGQDVTAGQDVFKTAPVAGTGTVRFIAFGDSGVGSSAQRQLAARMTAQTFDLAIHAGDVAYGTPQMVGGGSYAQYDAWMFDIYAAWLRSRPFFPTIGNHDDEVDLARPYRNVFVLPENGSSATYPEHAERYYSFDHGPVHFVALDTEFAFQDSTRRQAQLAWLEADLSATTQPWRVVYFHRSPYSSGLEHGSDLQVRNAFAPLFERHGVQLVISAHEHNYERSRPWREFGGAAVTYIVTGGGGAGLYGAGSAAWTAYSASVHHFVLATAGQCTLQLEAISVNGTTFDSHTLTRCF